MTLETVATGRVARRKTPGAVPALTAAALGGPAAPRRRALDASCDRHVGPAYSTTDRTAPFDSAPARVRLRPDQGFYLDVLSDSLDGDPRFERGPSGRTLVGAPIYADLRRTRVEGRQGVRIAYWMLFAGTEMLDRRGRVRLAREGGWERVDVSAVRARRAGRWRPVALFLYHGGQRRRIPWERAERRSSHPVVYLSRGSHVPSFEPGSAHRTVSFDGVDHPIVDRARPCGPCVDWRTWNAVRPVRSEAWFGFGGGWGLAYRERSLSGPPGPGASRSR